MKKFLAAILALLMVASMAACGGGGETGESEKPSTQPPVSENPQSTEPSEPTGPAQGEEISYTPLLHLDFETADGLTAVHQVAVTEDPTLTGATYALANSKHEILIANGYGAVGSSLMLDGKYGVKVENMPKTADDTYTIAFWYAADRYSQFGPLLQIGHNVGMNDQENEVAWINFTKTDTWSVEGGECAPVVWNRNSAENVWPWIGNNLDLLGKREWVHVALVVDGTTYKDDAGLPHVGARFYVNGVEVMNASAADIGLTDDAGMPINQDWKGVSPNILSKEGVYGIECLLGVNYWDQYSKEYIDELYLYDEALTAGQITTLYDMGNPPEYQTMPAYEGPTDDDTDTNQPTEPAEDEPGTLTVTGFFSKKTDFTALKSGETLTYTFKNTSNGSNNWENYVMAIVSADAASYTGADQEVAIIRADAWGWGGGASDFVAPDGEGNKLAFETNANFDEWQAKMKAGVDVKLTVALDGNTLTYNATIGEYTVSMTATSGVDLPDTLYVFFTGENCVLSNINVA